MKFRRKITFCMLALLSILFGIGGSVLIVSSFQDTMKQEKVTAENTYKMLQYTLQISGVQKLLSETGDIRNVIGQSIRQNGGYWDDILLTADGKEIYSSGNEALDNFVFATRLFMEVKKVHDMKSAGFKV